MSIEVKVGQRWRYEGAECRESPICGLEFVLPPNKATALAHLLVCAAKAVERNSQLTESKE